MIATDTLARREGASGLRRNIARVPVPLRLAMAEWIRERERSIERQARNANRGDSGTGRGIFVRLAGAQTQKFSAVLRRAGNFADRHLDDAAGDELAGLPADGIGAAAGHRRIRGADSHIFAGAVCGRVGRPVGPASRADRDANSGDAAIVRAGGADAFQSHQHSRNHRAERVAGRHQCV